MTRKRCIKLMMGRGISRNLAREITKTLQEMKEVEDQQKHCIKIGEMERGALLGGVYSAKRIRLYRWLGLASQMEERYSEKTTGRKATL